MQLQHTPFIQKQFSGTNVQGELSVFTIVKASYEFNDKGELKIADEQENIFTHDHFYQHPKNSSIHYPEESMPFKKGGELLVMGTLQPKADHTRQQTLTLKLKHDNTDWQKSLTVFGKRYWYSTLMGAKISEPLPLSEPTELRYELAFGGHAYPANPVGQGFTNKRFNVNDLELPQIEYTQALIRSPRSRPYVAGFNALAKHWQPRLQVNHHAAERHNLAPLDQQFTSPFHGDEVLQISGWTTQSLSAKPLIFSMPQPCRHENQVLPWDTVTVNMDARKVYLLTRLQS